MKFTKIPPPCSRDISLFSIEGQTKVYELITKIEWTNQNARNAAISEVENLIKTDIHDLAWVSGLPKGQGERRFFSPETPDTQAIHDLIFFSTQKGPSNQLIKADSFKGWYIAMLSYCNCVSFTWCVMANSVFPVMRDPKKSQRDSG